MLEPQIFEINIALCNEKKISENWFYQKFDDYAGTKFRQIIRIANGFPEEKSFEYKPAISINLATLNAFTEEAKHASNLSGSSLNAELVHCINRWLMERI